MEYVTNLKGIEPLPQEGRHIYWLLGPANGCTGGCSMAMGCYTSTEFVMTAGHTDQEGFHVLEGTGYAAVGDDVIRLEPGVSFLVKPGLDHAIKRDESCDMVKAIFFHAAV